MKNNQGFTLLETLIALVVLSVGMLGIASLHVEGLRNGRTATLRTKAMTLATDMAEKMRANRIGAQAGNYVSAAADAGANNDCADDLVGNPTVACTPTLMAQHDIWLWKRKLVNAQTGLPGSPTGVIISDGAAAPTFTITLNWTENGVADTVSLLVQP
ncbi:MAG: type IV pilus modification protein PilV [Gammaproteobacteria bacterium]|nr:type IV pilus modification protein PilV [Gammaproteobacteria bacterium]NNF60535.1 type IV pilus modification protein PilV [Gammaproteobacteria bacterium]NNM20283.1 type IV pilus modification protein PilV [Gammaproteobacteria bacterium]